MPVLPLIDLLILLGWTTLAAGGLLKAIYLATSYRPTLFNLTPIDLFVVAMAFLGLALTLAARTWVRLNEPHLLASLRRRNGRAREHFEPDEAALPNGLQPGPQPPASRATDAQASAAGWQRIR